MKKKSIIAVFLIGLCTAVLSAQTEADFRIENNDDGSVTIEKYIGWDSDIKIPAVINGKTVTVIGGSAFEGADLTSVVIPATVKRIGWKAFEKNKLISVIIPDAVHIPRRAFDGNPQLTSVTLGADCVLYSEFVFGYFVFYSYMCNDRKAGTYNIDREWDNNWISRRSQDREKVQKTAEGYTYAETQYGLAITNYIGTDKRLSIPGVLKGKSVKYIEGLALSGLTGLRIPDSVTSIGDRAFCDNQLVSVIFGNNVAFIGADAFKGNSQLKRVAIPASVKTIMDSAFSDLESITLPANVDLRYYDSFGFVKAYKENGKQAGMYIKSGDMWVYQAR